MANGYAQPILKHIASMTGWNPANKIGPLGFLQMVLQRMDGSVGWSQNYVDGHERELKVKFRKRPLKSEVRDTASNCDVASSPAYDEYTIPSLLHREVSFHLDAHTIRQYEIDASKQIVLDQTSGAYNLSKPTSVMNEVYSMFIEYGNALLASINEALVTQMSTSFGINTTTGLNTAKAVTFSLGTVALQDALVTLMNDWRENEMIGDDMAFVGSGPFSTLDLVKKFYSTIPNGQGFNMAGLNNSLPATWFDKDARAIWGDNHIGAFGKGSVHLLTRNYYEGGFKQKLANSTFFTMGLPVQEQVVPLEYVDRLKFDVQVLEVDCPTEMDINGVPTMVKEGVVIFLKKDFSLFTLPELYKDGDPLKGTNGTLRYSVTAT